MATVTKINHGNVFNSGNWFTFHCAVCNRQVTRQQTHCGCGCVIDWE